MSLRDVSAIADSPSETPSPGFNTLAPPSASRSPIMLDIAFITVRLELWPPLRVNHSRLLSHGGACSRLPNSCLETSDPAVDLPTVRYPRSVASR